MISDFRQHLTPSSEPSDHVVGTTAALIALGIGAAGSAATAAINAHAASSAADQQIAASDKAAQATRDASANSLAFQKQQWQQSQSNAEPWLAYGRGAVTTLGDLMGIKPIATTSQGVAPPGSYLDQNGAAVKQGTVVPLAPGADRVVAGPPPLLADGSQNPAWRQNMTTPATLGGMYGGPPSPTGAPPPAAGGAAPPSAAAVAPPPVAAASRIVRITWPDGSQAQVPSDQLNQYKSMGAEVAS